LVRLVVISGSFTRRPQKSFRCLLAEVTSQINKQHRKKTANFVNLLLGQNATYRENFRSLQEWRKNYDVRLSGQHDLSVMEEHFGRPGSFQAKLLDMPCKYFKLSGLSIKNLPARDLTNTVEVKDF